MTGNRSKSAKAGASTSKPERKISKVSKAQKAGGPSTKSAKSSAEIERDESGIAFWYFCSDQSSAHKKFTIAELENQQNGIKMWAGVRNFVSQNFMRAMKVGDRAFFCHSNAGRQTGIVGTVTIVKEAYPDHTAWDRNSRNHSDKGSKESPVWDMVDVKHFSTFKKIISRESLKDGPLKDMYMIRVGRTSVGPVRVNEWKEIMKICEEE